MTSRRYVLTLLALLFGSLGPFIAYNFLSDDFGLFWSTTPRRIWTLEKTSKYLMSYRYIPRHFNGLLVGPSYSDGLMDTRGIEGYRVYNISMDGGNATELRAATVNALERGEFKLMVICLSPYITKDSGIKGAQINAKEYWGSLLSLLPIDILIAKWQVLRDPAYDGLRDSTWGAANIRRPIYTWDQFVRVEHNDPLAPELRIDPVALRDLKAMIDTAHKHGVRIFAYFYPSSIWRSETIMRSGDWARYESTIRTLLDPSMDDVWDMMTPEYSALRADAACYTDGHLSTAGARLIMADINRHIAQKLHGLDAAPIFPSARTLACLGTPGAGSGFDRTE